MSDQEKEAESEEYYRVTVSRRYFECNPSTRLVPGTDRPDKPVSSSQQWATSDPDPLSNQLLGFLYLGEDISFVFRFF